MRIMTRTGLAVLMLAAIPAAGIAAEFDRTIPVTRGTRLELRLYGGEIEVHAWDRDAVRLRASHYSTDAIDVRTRAKVLQVGARTLRGTPHGIDFTIDVPAWMALDISGTYVDVTIAGTRADIKAETVRGDINVTGGRGTIVLKSIDGEITLEGGEARATLSSANNGIRVNGLRGDLLADSISGSIKLRGVSAGSIEATTVSGDISWDGDMTAAGRYQFATHAGDLDVALGESANVTLNIRPFNGQVRAPFPVRLPGDPARRQRITTILGAGTARLDLETFSGTISLRRPGA